MTELPSPAKGSRLLPSVLDQIGTETPDRIYASIPRSHNLDDGFREITHGEVLHAVDALATWLRDSFGVSNDFETLAYTGIADLRYTLIFFAAVKCGYKVLLASSRNATHQNVLLLQQTGCTKFCYSPEMAGVVKEIQVAMGNDLLRIVEIATFDEWLHAYTHSYPFTKSFEDARFDPILVLHSSGSTGSPKPITQTHQYFANCDRPLPQIPGRQIGGNDLWDYESGGYFLSPFPPYHLAGFNSFVYHPVFGKDCSLLLGFPDRPALPEVVLRMMMQKRVRLLFTPPSLVEGLLTLDGAVDIIKELDDIIYAGGPLEKSVGDQLAKLTRLSPIYGATETANITCLVQPPETWQYLEFHPAWKVIMEPEIDGAYELVLRKNSEADQYRGIGGTILREKPEYRTRDLFIPHSSRPELWRFYGRNDDIIVFSNGQKWNPIPSESLIQSHGGVSGVLIVGDRRFQPAAIIELKKPTVSLDNLMQSLWLLVEQANQQAQSYGRLTRSKIAIVQPGEFVRAPKGTVIRSATARKLHSVIEKLYSDLDDPVTKNKKQPLPNTSNSQLKVLQLVKDYARGFDKLTTAEDEDDLFAFGLDSLIALELAKSIRTGLLTYFDQHQLSSITTLMVFRYPSIKKLAHAVFLELFSTPEEENLQAKQKEIERMIETYTSTSNPQQATNALAKDSQLNIVLIGSTGFLGQHLLATLIQRPEIAKITCVDRNPLAKQTHHQMLRLIQPKAYIEFKAVSFTEMSLEDIQRYQELFENADGIIFSAWTVNFNQPLSFFEPQIRALSALCTVLISCKNSPRLFFVSSLSSSSDSKASDSGLTIVPEIVLPDASGSIAMGYAESKYVAERVLAKFARETGLNVTILRLGQIAGPITDSIGDIMPEENWSPAVWNEREWFPSVIKTSAHLGLIPSDLEPIDWIPVNLLTRGIAELIAHDIHGKLVSTLQVYNIVNPSPVSWLELVPAVQETMPSACLVVPLVTWIKDLKGKEMEYQAVEKYPALKILDYLEERTNASGQSRKIVVDNMKKASVTLGQMLPINATWARQWSSPWNRTTG